MILFSHYSDSLLLTFTLPNAMKNDSFDLEKSIEILGDLYDGIQDVTEIQI